MVDDDKDRSDGEDRTDPGHRLFSDGDYVVDPNLHDNQGKNALHIALESGLPVDLILKRYIPIEDTQNKGRPLNIHSLL